MPTENKTTEMESLKQRLKDTWSSGDFGQIARSYEDGAAEFISRLSLNQSHKVLDVACGTGNLSFPAARAGASVVGVDIAPNLIQQAREKAAQQRAEIKFEEGDAENLPYEDSHFDVVVTMFGAMFAPRPELVASELLRVTRPSGTIAMANWTPTSFVGDVFKTIGSFVPPPSIMPSPLLWGQPAMIEERFGKNVRNVETKTRVIQLQFELDPQDVVSFWEKYYGPTQRAFQALAAEPDKQKALHDELVDLWSKANKSSGRGTMVESEYMEVVVTR